MTKSDRSAYFRKWREGHRQQNRDATRRYHERLKIEVLTHYGNGKFACVRCGEVRIPCLSIDHINGGGVAQSKVVGIGHKLYRWLRRENYPNGYQTLCMNCQAMKKYENKEYGKYLLQERD